MDSSSWDMMTSAPVWARDENTMSAHQFWNDYHNGTESDLTEWLDNYETWEETWSGEDDWEDLECEEHHVEIPLVEFDASAPADAFINYWYNDCHEWAHHCELMTPHGTEDCLNELMDPVEWNDEISTAGVWAEEEYNPIWEYWNGYHNGTGDWSDYEWTEDYESWGEHYVEPQPEMDETEPEQPQTERRRRNKD
jgi:hypothetical protein